MKAQRDLQYNLPFALVEFSSLFLSNFLFSFHRSYFSMAEEGEYVEEQQPQTHDGKDYKMPHYNGFVEDQQEAEEENVDVWDDSALVDAYNTAIKKYMVTDLRYDLLMSYRKVMEWTTIDRNRLDQHRRAMQRIGRRREGEKRPRRGRTVAKQTMLIIQRALCRRVRRQAVPQRWRRKDRYLSNLICQRHQARSQQQ